MYVLTDEQIEFIRNDIRRNGIELEELQLDLLDHICCVIETEHTAENDFEAFYRSILPRFYKRSLREIQEETHLLLTFKNYYAMKKVMFMSGAFSAFTVLIGSLFKIMHWPGAALLFVIAIALFSFVFLPILSVIRIKEQTLTKDKIVITSAAIFGSAISLAILFKVMHWPFATILWTISLGILFFLFLPVYFFGGIRNPATKTNTIVSSILILIAGGLLFLITNLRGSQAFDEAINNADQQIVENYQLLSQKNPSDTVAIHPTINEKASELCLVIEGLKQALAKTVVPQNPNIAESEVIQLYGHVIEPIQAQLFVENGAASPELKNIQLKLNELEKLVNTKIKWNVQQVKDLPFSYVLRNLNLLLLRIRIVENTKH